jgi:hypothetical protein
MTSEQPAGRHDPLQARLDEIRATRAGLLARLQGLTTEQGAWHPDDQWGLQQVLEHLVLAERGGFDLIWRAAEAFRTGDPVWTGDSENHGLTLEEIVHRTWRPREKAPASAEPRGDGTLGLWAAHLASCDTLMAHLPSHLSDLPLEEVIYPQSNKEWLLAEARRHA